MRLPFTSVALAPFGTGIWLAHVHGTLTSPLAAWAGFAAVLFICVGCYLTGEIFDRQEDLLTETYGRSKFAGGTLMVAHGQLSVRAVGVVVAVCIVGALGLGLLVVLEQRAVWLLGLGAFGAISALLYSVPPVRLVKRGVGEIFIGVCYGWLTLVTGYASASGSIPPYSLLLSLPMALTVFNVILINEYPDFLPDAEAGKRTLLQRVGRIAGAWLYATASLGSAVFLIAIWITFRRSRPDLLLAAAPAVMLSAGLAVAVAPLGRWRNPAILERICGLTIVLNLVCSMTVGVLARW